MAEDAQNPPSERQPLLDPSHAEDSSRRRRESIVSFAEGDSGNPREWSAKYRWFSVVILCLQAAIVTYTCIGIVPVAGDVVLELKGHKDRTSAVLFVTIWELGEATGPLFIAPLSELYGRFIVYNVANGLFIAGIVIGALSQGMELLIFARFLTGCAVAANVLNPAIIGDMFPSESRGAAMSAVMLAPLVGGALGPTVSGALADAAGWRQIIWMCAGIAAVIEILFLSLLRETYEPVILKRRAEEKRKQTGDQSFTTEYEDQEESAKDTIWQAMLRPMKIIWSSSMLQTISLWGGLGFAFFYVNSTSLPDILEMVYKFGATKRGISYLAWSTGTCIGLLICNLGMDRIYNKLTKRHGAFYPEARLSLVISGAFSFPLTIALYGWTAELRLPVAAFLGSVSLLGISLVLSIVPLMTFITDAFGQYSASALTAVLIIRCLCGAFLPLLLPPLSDKVGYGFAFLVLAAVMLLVAPVPAIVMKYGPGWRQRSVYTQDK